MLIRGPKRKRKNIAFENFVNTAFTFLSSGNALSTEPRTVSCEANCCSAMSRKAPSWSFFPLFVMADAVFAVAKPFKRQRVGSRGS